VTVWQRGAKTTKAAPAKDAPKADEKAPDAK
jgi:hypothetical protein